MKPDCNTQPHLTSLDALKLLKAAFIEISSQWFRCEIKPSPDLIPGYRRVANHQMAAPFQSENTCVSYD